MEKSKKRQVPLIVEQHPEDYTGLPFITLIQYNNQSHLTVVDNAEDKFISAFVLDLCGPESIDQQAFFDVVSEWYETSKDDHPLSIALSMRGLTNVISRIHKTFNIDFVSRVIGPIHKFPMQPKKSIRRRKRKDIPKNASIRRTKS